MPIGLSGILNPSGGGFDGVGPGAGEILQVGVDRASLTISNDIKNSISDLDVDFNTNDGINLYASGIINRPQIVAYFRRR